MRFILIMKTFTCHLNHNFNETFIHFDHSNVFYFLFLLCRIAAASTAAAAMENKERPETRVSEFNRVTDACSTRYETRPESSPSPCLKINKSYGHTYMRSINNVRRDRTAQITLNIPYLRVLLVGTCELHLAIVLSIPSEC